MSVEDRLATIRNHIRESERFMRKAMLPNYMLAKDQNHPVDIEDDKVKVMILERFMHGLTGKRYRIVEANDSR